MPALEPQAVWTAKRRSFRDIYEELDETVVWLGQFKPKHLSTRIDQYKKNLLLLADAHDAGKVTELLERRNEECLMNSFLEASSLNLIYRGLRKFDKGNAVLRDKIDALFSGPEHSNDENPTAKSNNTWARNTSFELVMAACFAAAGYDIHFDPEADLIINDGLLLFVESKRIYSDKRIKGNIDEALDQLDRRYLAGDPKRQKRGLIAISISKLINPRQRLLSARNVEHLRSVLNELAVNFIRDHRRHWAGPHHRNTVGIIIHLHVPSEIREENEYFTCREIALNEMQPIGPPEDRYFDEVAIRLQARTDSKRNRGTRRRPVYSV